MVKRPLKDLYLELAGSSIEFFILVAREKEEYQNDEDKAAKEPKKMIPDVVKDTPYEMTLGLYFGWDDAGKWYAEVTKTQGGLGTIFPKGKRLTKLPMDELFAYAKKIDKTTAAPVEKSEDDIATEFANDTFAHTSAGLIAYGKEKGCTAKDVGAALKAVKTTAFEADKWSDMVKAIDVYVAGKVELAAT
jgi:hypothetical protein